ncbi:hypothetical protein IMCC3317_14880 [Kordia antarctica]|uniref:Lipoprotein n=1 Tax=Kordia antarctica TaxID=1218801 RepID=A0A7L4ZJP4_9FLAO|nr:hypothetical protein [Kordia antarctica]QHI36134.1 hypothetical protein IMCC3317_14880 [Kordia antarctica]
MKYTLLLILTLLLISCSKNEKAENIRHTVELAIKNDAKMMNEIIREFNNNKVNGIDNSKKLLKMYHEATKTHLVCKDLIIKLDDIDSCINLKKEALDYFNFTEFFLIDFIKPMATLSFKELQGNEELQKKMTERLAESIEVSKKMSDKILEFCKEHNLEMEISVYEGEKFSKQVEELKNNL